MGPPFPTPISIFLILFTKIAVPIYLGMPLAIRQKIVSHMHCN